MADGHRPKRARPMDEESIRARQMMRAIHIARKEVEPIVDERLRLFRLFEAERAAEKAQEEKRLLTFKKKRKPTIRAPIVPQIIRPPSLKASDIAAKLAREGRIRTARIRAVQKQRQLTLQKEKDKAAVDGELEDDSAFQDEEPKAAPPPSVAVEQSKSARAEAPSLLSVQDGTSVKTPSSPIRKSAPVTKTIDGTTGAVQEESSATAKGVGGYIHKRLRWENERSKRTPDETWAEFALRKFGSYLTDHERSEILGFGDSVYFVGEKAEKFLPDKKEPNYGYDLDGVYQAAVIEDHLYYRYEVLDFLGSGSFGTVSELGIMSSLFLLSMEKNIIIL